MLADYCLPGADPDLQEPLATRLLGLLEHFAGRLMILSGRRDTAEQQVLFDQWDEYAKDPVQWHIDHPGQKPPALAARPGTSKHENGGAADLKLFDGLTWKPVHAEGARRGLHFPIPKEDWHAEPIPGWVDEEDDDMTDEQIDRLAKAIARELDARQRKVHSYRDGLTYEVDARTLEEYEFAETQQAALAAQGQTPK